MNNIQRGAIASFVVSAFFFGLTYGTSVNHAVAPVPISELGLTPEAAAETQKAVATMPPLMVVGADSDADNRVKRVAMHVAVREANGGEWPWHGPQETGDCNAFATCLATELDLAWQIKNGADYEWKQADRPWAYYGGRVRNGHIQLSGEGSVPSWSAEWFRDDGILWMSDAPPYSGQRAKQWGSGSGPPQTMFEKASPYRIGAFAQMRDAQDVCNALCAGYPVLFGSMKWGTTSIKLVEGRNVASDTTNWPHAECFVAYDGTTTAYGKRGLFRIMNSWGPKAHMPLSTLPDDAPGGYYVTDKVVDMICAEGMAFSISGTRGFPKRDLNFDVFGAAGAAVPNKEAIMQPPFEMDKLIGYGIGSIALVLGIILFVLGRMVGNGLWRTGAAALAAILAVSLLSDAQAQDLNFDVISNPPNFGAETPDQVDGLNFAVLTSDVHEAVNAAVNGSPLNFKVMTHRCDCVGDCDCDDADGCDCEAKRRPAKPPSHASGRRSQWLMFTQNDCRPCDDAKADFTAWLRKSGWIINKTKQAHIRLMNIDDNPEYEKEYGVSAFPSFVLMIDGKEDRRHEGYAIREKVAADGKPWKAEYFDRAKLVSEYETAVNSLTKEKPVSTRRNAAEAAPTPMAEVVRVLDLLPKPEVAFVDFGCGHDARWCVAAAEKWKCRVVGVENDPERAAAASERVRALRLDQLITIIEGDAETTDVKGDVAAVYLYPDLLKRLKPRLEKFNAVASYMHAVPGLAMRKDGDSFIYRRGVAAVALPAPVQNVQRGAVWGGMVYQAPVCNSPHCQMCNSIRAQTGYR